MITQPEIVTCPARTFMGLRANFIAAGYSGANNLSVIPRLWTSFFRRIQEVPTNQPGVCYGLSRDVGDLGENAAVPGECAYLAAVQVKPGTALPPGMTTWETHEGRHAKFIHRGSIEHLGATYVSIYQKWLPGSGFSLAPGPVWEWYDERFIPSSNESELEIFVPVMKRP